MRLLDRKAKRGKFQVVPTLLTWIISIVWHGFYFGFIFSFCGTFFIAFAWGLYESSKFASVFESLFIGPTKFLLLLLKHILVYTLISSVLEHFWLKDYSKCWTLIEN